MPSDPRFGCGPSLVPTEFVEELLTTGPHLLGTSHRQTAVKELVRSLQEMLVNYFSLPDDFAVLMGNGGATMLFDAIGLNLVEKKSLHLTCGEFSHKWYKAHANIPWIESVEVSTPWTQEMDLKGADVLCCTLNETSTGMMLPQIPVVDDRTLLCMDATSGAGQIDCPVSKVDVFFFSLQKIFASDGGSFVAILSPKAQERMARLARENSHYIPHTMNLQTHLTSGQKQQTYNTPAITTLFFFQRQLQAMNRAGYQQMLQEGLKRSRMIYDWVESKDYLDPYVKEKDMRSHTVATIEVDKRIDVASLLKRLKLLKAVYGIEPYRKLGGNQFRIALFYGIKSTDLEKLTELLSHALESFLSSKK